MRPEITLIKKLDADQRMSKSGEGCPLCPRPRGSSRLK
jgi:hypothetical protein